MVSSKELRYIQTELLEYYRRLESEGGVGGYSNGFIAYMTREGIRIRDGLIYVQGKAVYKIVRKYAKRKVAGYNRSLKSNITRL